MSDYAEQDDGDVVLLHNAKIWTCTDGQDVREASLSSISRGASAEGARESSGDKCSWMTFNRRSGLITRVGREGSGPPPNLLSSLSPDRLIDCDKRRVLPGLHESHLHVALLGRLLVTLNVQGCRSPEELRNAISSYSASHPDKPWIVGRGWEQDLLGRYPSREDLDAACSDRPVVITRVCGHAAVVNSLALTIAGITNKSVDPAGGCIVRYQTDDVNDSTISTGSGVRRVGEPSGVLLENAIDLVKPFFRPTSAEKIEMIEAALSTLLKNGVTSAHACEEETWNEFCQLADAGRLPLRIFFSAYLLPRTPGNFPGPGEQHGPMLSCDRIKLFADGALGASTAAISLPYCNSCNDHGVLMQTPEALTALIHEATAAGFRLEIHVIGDRAVEVVLDGLEAVPVAPEKRPILTHCQILREDLVRRMKALGVIANIQPQFVPTDARWIQEKLSPDLMTHAYAWKTLLQSGVHCAGGSDAPVEAPEPLIGMYDAIYREYGGNGRHSKNNLVFKPEECLTFSEALDIYTRGGAYATMKEQELGQLLPGYQADFIVLDRDVAVNPRDLDGVKVEQVWVAGQRKL